MTETDDEYGCCEHECRLGRDPVGQWVADTASFASPRCARMAVAHFDEEARTLETSVQSLDAAGSEAGREERARSRATMLYLRASQEPATEV